MLQKVYVTATKYKPFLLFISCIWVESLTPLISEARRIKYLFKKSLRPRLLVDGPVLSEDEFKHEQTF